MGTKFVFALFLVLVHVVISTGRNIDKSLLKVLKSHGKYDILINFEGANSRVIKKVELQGFGNRFGKVKALTEGLQSFAQRSQGAIQEYLQEHNVAYQTFWSSNQMVVRNANLNTVRGVATFGQVSRIQMLPTVKLIPLPSKVTPAATNSTNVTYGVAKIQADKVWAQFGANGAGVVVANIDTGVRGTHEALAGNFRSDHGWYDPYTNTTTPNDQNGHGTHTMGTICGTNGIGMAPGAKWIACRGCGSSSCDAAQLLACGQWMLSPTAPDGTGPDPTKIPDVVSNSWGSNVGGDTWYNATIDAWKAAGIMHAFAIGNQGPLCRSGGSPGDQPTTFSVGSTDANDKLSSFSSKGPAGTYPSTYIKPDISAPGSNVLSAWYNADNAYNTISGTSMATPHVAGTIALMLSAYRTSQGNMAARMNFTQITKSITSTADTQGLAVGFPNFSCDFTFGAFPNNQFGYGRINALKAVNATVSGSSAAGVTISSNI